MAVWASTKRRLCSGYSQMRYFPGCGTCAVRRALRWFALRSAGPRSAARLFPSSFIRTNKGVPFTGLDIAAIALSVPRPCFPLWEGTPHRNNPFLRWRKVGMPVSLLHSLVNLRETAADFRRSGELNSRNTTLIRGAEADCPEPDSQGRMGALHHYCPRRIVILRTYFKKILKTLLTKFFSSV